MYKTHVHQRPTGATVVKFDAKITGNTYNLGCGNKAKKRTSEWVGQQPPKKQKQ